MKEMMLDSPLGPLLAVGDGEFLYVLDFAERVNRKRLNNIKGTTPPIDSIKKELEQYFAGTLKEFKTPIAVMGSPFQKTVWKALQEIPYGETRSYAELATSIGKPTAFRAAANANGANQLAIIIPCHRVINSDGKIGGYGGGVARKQWLLQHELNQSRLY